MCTRYTGLALLILALWVGCTNPGTATVRHTEPDADASTTERTDAAAMHGGSTLTDATFIDSSATGVAAAGRCYPTAVTVGSSCQPAG
ncbi:MAG TPA: hypothetical protein VF331_19335, partial [Polyangiales bacterium]